MRNLIGILVVLALPAMAYGTAMTWLESGGSTSKFIPVSSLPTTMTLDVWVSWTTAHNFCVSGGVDGPAAITIAARSYGSPFNLWDPNDPDAWYLGSNLAQELDYGALDMMGSHEAGPGAQRFVTITLNIPVMAKGSYPLWICDGMPYGKFNGHGYWMSEDLPSDDDFIADWDYVGGFMLNIIPEPATILLLAGAVPFLRRRIV